MDYTQFQIDLTNNYTFYFKGGHKYNFECWMEKNRTYVLSVKNEGRNKITSSKDFSVIRKQLELLIEKHNIEEYFKDKTGVIGDIPFIGD